MGESSSFTSSMRDARMKLSQFPFFSWNGIWNGPTLHFTLKPIKTLCVLARFVFPPPCAIPWTRDARESRGERRKKVERRLLLRHRVYKMGSSSHTAVKLLNLLEFGRPSNVYLGSIVTRSKP